MNDSTHDEDNSDAKDIVEARNTANAEEALANVHAWEGGCTLAEILAMELPPPKWAINGMVAEGLTILAGPSKIGKSWLGLDMCLSVARGSKVLGFQAEQGEALYLALEDKPRRMQERAREMQADSSGGRAGVNGGDDGDGNGSMNCADRLHIFFDWPRLDGKHGGFEQLEQTLTAHPELRLVVIDTYAKVKPPLQPNKPQYEQEYRDANRLKRLAEDTEVAIVVVTHTTKLRADTDPFLEISGSVGLTAAMDNGVVLRYAGSAGPAGSRTVEMYLRGRDVMDTTLAVHFDDASKRWQLAEADPFAHLTPEQRQTSWALYQHVELSPQQLATLVGISVDAAQLRLNKLNRLGVAERTRKGVYMLNDEYLLANTPDATTIEINARVA